MNADGNELGDVAELWLRMERLEREVAELRRVVAVPASLPRDEGVAVRPRTMAAPPPLVYVEPETTPVLSVPPPPQSLENRLGAQIFNRIAIVALLVGTAYGLKLAIDNGLLGPVARVLIGLAAGAGLVLWSERFRRQRVEAFSYSLKAVGSGVLYLSLWAAFQLYHLLPDTVALGAMVLVTAWNAWMAWSQDAELLAAYALIGGFLTPVLLATGGDHEVFLFTYVLAIDVATVALVRLKRWPRLLLGTFPATVLYLIGWYSQWYAAPLLWVTALYLVLFWLVFVAASVGRYVPRSGEEPRDSRVVPQDVLLPLSAAAFVALGLYFVLQDSGHHAWLAWLMVALAGAYLGIMRLPQRAAVAVMHLSLSIVFLTIAIPLKANGHWITVAWLVEGAALFWASTRLDQPTQEAEASSFGPRVVLRRLALGALGLGCAAVLVSSYWFSSGVRSSLLNSDVATALTGIATVAAAGWMTYRQREPEAARGILLALLGAINLLALLLTLREVVVTRYVWPAATPFAHADLASAMIGVAVLAGAAWAAFRLAEREPDQPLWPQLSGASGIALNAVAVLSGVREVAALWRYGVTRPNDRLQEALAISGFLMLYSAMLLAVGFWQRTALVRWQGLVLLVFTIAKTFLHDTSSLSQGYRVVSFLGLGVLLMGVSFAYQKDWLGLREAPAAPTGERR